ALATGRRVVFHIHGGGFEDFYRAQRRFLRAVMDGLLRRVHLTLCTCPTWERRLRRLCSDLRPVVLPNPVDCALFSDAASATTRDGDPVSVLFMGATRAELNRAKGLFELLEAVGRLAARGVRCRLLLAGCDLASADERRAV